MDNARVDAFFSHTLDALKACGLTRNRDIADRLCRQLVSLTVKYDETICGFLEWEDRVMRKSTMNLEDAYPELEKLRTFIEANQAFFADARTRKHLRDSRLYQVVYYHKHL